MKNILIRQETLRFGKMSSEENNWKKQILKFGLNCLALLGLIITLFYLILFVTAWI